MKRMLFCFAAVFLSMSFVAHGQRVDLHFVDEALQALDTAAYHKWMLQCIRDNKFLCSYSARQRRKVCKMYKEAVAKYVPVFIPIVWLDWNHYVETGDVVLYPTSHKTPYCPFQHATGGWHAWLPKMRYPLFESLDYPFDVCFLEGDRFVFGLHRVFYDDRMCVCFHQEDGYKYYQYGEIADILQMDVWPHRVMLCPNLNVQEIGIYLFEEEGQLCMSNPSCQDGGKALVNFLHRNKETIQQGIDHYAKSCCERGIDLFLFEQ